jgi:hypothetical protein
VERNAQFAATPLFTDTGERYTAILIMLLPPSQVPHSQADVEVPRKSFMGEAKEHHWLIGLFFIESEIFFVTNEWSIAGRNVSNNSQCEAVVGARSIGMYIHKISRQDNLIHPAETS